MVSAILLYYVIEDPLPIRDTFGDPGSNPGADNFFFFGLYFSFFPHMISFLMLYFVCMVASC